jgi:hypothetical protein
MPPVLEMNANRLERFLLEQVVEFFGGHDQPPPSRARRFFFAIMARVA